jgi:hypothetical protein
MLAKKPLSWSPIVQLPAVVALCALSGLLAACHHPAQAQPVSIEISHLAGTEPLQLGSSFKTAAGDELSLDKLRYYLSNLRLRRADGSWFVNPQWPQKSDGYFLVDEAVASSKKLRIGPVPDGDYSGIEFLIGIDDTRNHAGAQTGPLDPAKGMFWMWHSGYIFLKIEGHSPQSTASEQQLSYHVGGGDVDAPLARTVFLPLPEPLHVRPQLDSEIHLDADVAAVFGGSHPLRLAELPEAMEPPAVVPVADNFASAFRVDHVHNLPRRAGEKKLP